MPGRRRIVLDNSALIPAYFREYLAIHGDTFDLTPRAKRLRRAVELREVTAFAPHQLLSEFLRVANNKMRGRSDSGELDAAVVDEQVSSFLDDAVPEIVWSPSEDLVRDAWQLTRRFNLAPPDSWYVACALQHNAELWVSHRHADGFTEHAKSAGVRVFTLTEHTFDGTNP